MRYYFFYWSKLHWTMENVICSLIPWWNIAGGLLMRDGQIKLVELVDRAITGVILRGHLFWTWPAVTVWSGYTVHRGVCVRARSIMPDRSRMSSITIGHSSSVCVVDICVSCDLPSVNVRRSRIQRAVDGIRRLADGRHAGPPTFNSARGGSHRLCKLCRFCRLKRKSIFVACLITFCCCYSITADSLCSSTRVLGVTWRTKPELLRR